MGGKKRFKIRTWHFIILLVPLLFWAAFLLRSDHIKMTELRDAVLAADAEENDENIASSLKTLQEYTFKNIIINIVDDNGIKKVTFGTGVFYLEHQYYRAANAALEKAEAKMGSDSNPNGNIYAKAMSVCKPIAIANRWNWTSQGYIDCMLGEIAKYPATSNIEDTIIADLPSTELYRINYASPLWAPSLSGFVLLACAIIIVVIFIRFIIWCALCIAVIFLKNR